MQTTGGVAWTRDRGDVVAGVHAPRAARHGAPRTSLATWLRRHPDLVAVVILAMVPVVWFGTPALAGHPALPGDDLLQNFPLRVLVGEQLRHGTLPTYDPYIWGGAPLLGGWNAGAFYPLTLLFAILPGALAWTINLVAVYWVGVLGLYALVRSLGRRPSSSALAAASFGFAGAMDVQVVHLGLVAGMSWAPLVLLAMRKLALDPDRRGRLRWTAVLAVASSMVVLAGEPRAIATVAVIAAVFLLWLLARTARPLVPFLSSVFLAVGIAVLVSAVQWLPGAEAVSTSQRAVDTYILYGSGSLPPRWLTLGLVPTLLGGSGSFGSAGWFTGYNLPEVMSYVGLLPLAGALGMLGTLRRRRPLPDWLVWHGMALVGIALSLGSFTPLGHVLVRIPLFGGQRLQSRNIAVTDLALTVLLAYFVDFLIDRARPATSEAALVGGPAANGDTAAANGAALHTPGEAVDDAARRAQATPGRVDRAGRVAVGAALVVPLAGAVLAIVAAASPATMGRLMGATSSQAALAAPQRPLDVAFAVLSMALVVVLVRARRTGTRRLVGIIVAFVVADLTFFNLTSVWAWATNLGRPPAQVTATPGASGVPLRLPAPLGTTGRFVMYNPNVTTAALQGAGEPDLNVPQHRYSAQGYSSIVDGTYAAVTGSHLATGAGTNTLAPNTLVNGVFDALDTTTLVTYPSALILPGAHAAVPGDEHRVVPAGTTTRWVFGEQLDLLSVSLPVAPTASGTVPGAGLQVVLEQGDGRDVVTHPALSFARGVLDVRFASPSPAVALVVTATARYQFPSAPVLHTTGGGAYVAGGPLQDVLDGTHWSFVGDHGPLAYFFNNRAQAPLSLLPAPGAATTTGASVRAVSGPTIVPTAAAVSSPRGVRVVRSVAAIPGWSATWRPDGAGRAEPLAVQRLGLVQAVDVPAGQGVLTWQYAAPGLETGAWCALAGGGLLVVVLGALWLAGADPRWGRGRTRRTTRDHVSVP